MIDVTKMKYLSPIVVDWRGPSGLTAIFSGGAKDENSETPNFLKLFESTTSLDLEPQTNASYHQRLFTLSHILQTLPCDL